MTLHFWSAAKLADDLGHERLSQSTKAYYMLAGFAFSILVGYTPLTFTNSGHVWLGMYEGLFVLAITVYGFERCYTAAGGNNNTSFISDFMCLALPVAIKTTFICWGIYWGGWYMLQHLLVSTSFESQRAIKIVKFIYNDLARLTVLGTVVASNAIYYLSIASHLKRIAVIQKSCRNLS